ncbi:hypothetical protein CTAYLR_010303 [Chrysophaeum taylorii]|uniref:Flavin reductase like domain-containing protein n=1 Tax=Chrysophaeum taylorii TaxID=2483200 RepID=A0AAD7UIF2_9STRA|nr:hypothetical protein CTAYLR_010303 [Chrysophaeum taylorii]
MTEERVILRAAAELAALRLRSAAEAVLSEKTSVSEVEAETWSRVIVEALPREVNAKSCHSKVLGVASFDGGYFAAYALDRARCAGETCAYGDELTFCRGRPGVWEALNEATWRPFYEWRSEAWDPRCRPWMRATSWVRYADPVTGENVDSFVARFSRGIVIAGTFAAPKARWIVLRDPKLASRLLYPNPVVVLTALVDGCRSCMALSWLTPVDNDRRFVFAVNRRRHTARALVDERPTKGAIATSFGLSVMAAGSEELVLAIGAVSGAVVGDKEAHISGLHYDDNDDDDDDDACFFVRGCVARVAARVDRVVEATEDHHIVLATMGRAAVVSTYWREGKLFAPGDAATPGLLSFLGSKTFAHLHMPPTS